MTLALYLGLGFGVGESVLYILYEAVPLKTRIPSLIFHPLSAMITASGIESGEVIRFLILSFILHSGSNLFKFISPDQ